MPTKIIEGYAIHEYSSRELIGTSSAVAYIHLYGEGRYRGYIAFYPDGVALRDASFDEVNERFYLHFNLSQFHPTMEMLRTEEPIYVVYNNPTFAYLRTGHEPTGEEETP